MNIILNNRPETINGHQSITVKQLLEIKNFSYKMLMVRVNDTTLHKDDYPTTIIRDGDKVAVIHLMTGG